jgi:hypothetical protein
MAMLLNTVAADTTALWINEGEQSVGEEHTLITRTASPN